MFFGNIMLLKGDDIMNYARWATKEEMLKFLKEVDINSDIKKSGIPIGYDKNNLEEERKYVNKKWTSNFI